MNKKTEQVTTSTVLGDIPSQAWNNVDAESAKQTVTSAHKHSVPEMSPSGLFKALSEEFVQEQEELQTHRGRLINWFTLITVVQLLIVNVLVFIAIFGRQESTQMILNFMSYFVGATFVELIGGLYIIVKYVFSHSTSDMLKHLTPVNITNTGKTE